MFELTLLSLVCLTLAGIGLCSREGVINFYLFIASFTLIYWLPQLYVQSSSTSPFPGLDKFILMITLSICCLSFGHFLGQKSKTPRATPPIGNRWGFCLTASSVGVIGLVILFSLPPSLRDLRQPEGMVVVAAFLLKAFEISFSLSIAGWLESKQRRYIGLAAFPTLYLLYRVLIVAKRTAVIQPALAIVGLLWFFRRFRVPAAFIVALIPFTVALIGFGHIYRSEIAGGQGQWSAKTFSIDKIADAFTNALSRFDGQTSVTGNSYYEVRNGCMNIEAVSRTGEYDFGRQTISEVATTAFPRQIFGSSIRKWAATQTSDSAFAEFNYTPKKGTPPTGFATAFRAFGFFGAILFLPLGYVIGIIFRLAEQKDFLAAGIWPYLYFVSINTMTHDINRFFSGLIVLLVVLIPSYVAASISPSQPHSTH